MKSRKGIITRILKQKGFGYITDQDSVEVWFHASGVINPKFEDLREGQVVNFYLVPCKNGSKAIGLNISDLTMKRDKELLKNVKVTLKNPPESDATLLEKVIKELEEENQVEEPEV